MLLIHVPLRFPTTMCERRLSNTSLIVSLLTCSLLPASSLHNTLRWFPITVRLMTV